MAWWSNLPYPDTLGGILITAAVVSVLLVASGLGLAFAWHKFKASRKARAASTRAR